MKILRHRLVEDDNEPYPYVASPNVGGQLLHRYLIIHYTAGPNADVAINSLTNPHRPVSAHLVIGRDGSLTQLVPFNRVAWHAGASRWLGLEGLNQYSIGIELDNAGKLERHGDKWRAWFGFEYDPADVVEAVHQNGGGLAGWHLYSAEQLETCLAVSRLLVNRYGLQDVLGHDEIAPWRKIDPGPAFPMRSFRAAVFGRAEDESRRYATTANLNIRIGPGTEHETLPGSPLPEGTCVEILDTQGSWCFVDVLDTVEGLMDLQGWVHGRYLTLIE
jgi:N-acetylmuramoyl-L-alanine amidase